MQNPDMSLQHVRSHLSNGEAVAEGVRSVAECEAIIKRVPETLPDSAKMGALEAKKHMEQIPIATVEELPNADAIIFSTPTRFSNMCVQMRQFLDATGGLWVKRSAGRESGERLRKLYDPARAARSPRL